MNLICIILSCLGIKKIKTAYRFAYIAKNYIQQLYTKIKYDIGTSSIGLDCFRSLFSGS